MTIDQPGAEEIAFHIDGRLCLIISETDNKTLPDRHVGPLDLARKNIDHSSVLDQEIGFPFAGSYSNIVS